MLRAFSRSICFSERGTVLAPRSIVAVPRRPVSVQACRIEDQVDPYDESEINPFPYLFLNSASIGHLSVPRRSSLQSNVDVWEKSLDTQIGPTSTLRKSLQELYYELLVSLALRDRKSLDKICEANLVRHFEEGLQWMEPHIQHLKVKNIAHS